jgi:hypothetical protein
MDPRFSALAPTAIGNAYHVGCLVPDLREAMTRLSQQLQITWAAPFEMDSGFTTADGAPDSDRVRIAYSSDGPPYLEIIEVVDRPGSIFAAPANGGFHHLGVFAERWRDETARLSADGMEVERLGVGVAFVRDSRTGLRIEVVSFKGRDFLTRILSGEMGREHPLSDG